MTTTGTFSIDAVRERFSSLQSGFAFFDAPGGSQVPDEVGQAIANALRDASANLGAPYATGRAVEAILARAKEDGGRFLGCSPGEVSFGMNMTSLDFILTRAATRDMREGDEILTTQLDHDGGVAPWVERAEDMGLVVRVVRATDDLTVVYDDLDLPLGRVRIRKGGGHGGHNGMRDILAALDSGDFARVRIGLGRPPSGEDVVDHVLRPFTPDERPVIERAVDDAVAALEAILTIGLDNAMNQFNRDPRGAPVLPAGRPAPSTDATAPARASRSKAAPTALARTEPDEAPG
jgi:hypothetical protein